MAIIYVRNGNGDLVPAGSSSGVAVPDELEQVNMLIETDMLPAVHDGDGAVLTDENGNVILRY